MPSGIKQSVKPRPAGSRVSSPATDSDYSPLEGGWEAQQGSSQMPSLGTAPSEGLASALLPSHSPNVGFGATPLAPDPCSDFALMLSGI